MQANSTRATFTRPATTVMLIAIAYFVAACLALLFTISPGKLAVVWLPAGLALAIMLLMPRSAWGSTLAAIFLAGALAHWTTGSPLQTSLILAAVNTLETGIFAWLLTRRNPNPVHFARLADMVNLTGLALVVNAPLALIGATVTTLDSGVLFWNAWGAWYIGNGLGILLLTPLIVIWLTRGELYEPFTPRRLAEGTVLVLAQLGLAYLTFGKPDGSQISVVMRPVLILPLLIVFALRYSPRGTSVALLLVNLVGMAQSLQGTGIFSALTAQANQQILATQVFFIVCDISILILSSLVAEQRRTQNTLAANEIRFRRLYEDAPLAYQSLDEQGKVIQVNAAWCAMFGFTHEEILGHWIGELFPPDQLERLSENFAKFKQAGEMHNVEYQMMRRDGTPIFIEFDGKIVRDAQGHFVQTHCILVDITQRKEAQQALHTSEARFRSLVENIPGAVYRCSVQSPWQVSFMSDAFTQIFGDAPQILTSGAKNYADLILPDDLPLVERCVAEGVAQHQPYEIEYRIRHADGQIRWVFEKGQAYYDDANQPSYLQGMVFDITARKATEDALAQSEKLYRSLVNVIPDGVALSDAQGNIQFASPHLLTMHGGAPDEPVIGANALQWIAPEHHGKARANIQALFSNDTLANDHEYTLLRRDGTRFIGEIDAVVLRDEQGVPLGMVTIHRDITAKKRAEQELRASQAQLDSIFQAAPIGIGVVTNRVIQTVNATFCKLLQYTCEELVGQNTRMLYPTQAEYDYVGTEWYRQIYAHNLGTVETQWQCKDGTILHILLSSTSIDPANLSHGVLFTALDITERKRAEEQLTRLNECLLSFGADPLENINRLTELCGELLGADCALYNRLDQGMLCSWGQWHTPPGYNPKDNPAGHICFDVIQRAEDQIFIVRDLPATPYAQTDPNVMPYHLQTYVGQAVKFGGQYVGSLCTVFQRDFLPTEEQKRLVGIIASAIGVEEKRKHAEEALHTSEEKFRKLFEASSDPLFLLDAETGEFYAANMTALRQYGYTQEELVGLHSADLSAEPEKSRASLASHDTFIPLRWHRRKDGSTFPVEINISYFTWNDRRVRLSSVRDISTRLEAENALRTSEERYRLLFTEMLNGFALHEIICDAGGLPCDYRFLQINPAFEKMTGLRAQDIIGKTVLEVLPDTESHWINIYGRVALTGEPAHFENHLSALGKYFEVMAFSPQPGQFAVTFADVTARRQRERELEAIASVSAALRKTNAHTEMLPLVIEQTAALLRAEGAAIALYDPATGASRIEWANGLWTPMRGRQIPAEQGISGHIWATGEPYLTTDVPHDPLMYHRDMADNLHGSITMPLIALDHTIGWIGIGMQRTFNDTDVRVLGAIADIAANAIHRANLHEQTMQHVQRLTALNVIDRTINASLDLRVTLNILLDQVNTQLGADASMLVLFNRQTQMLECRAERGMRCTNNLGAWARLGNDMTSRAIIERRMVSLPDLELMQDSIALGHALAPEKFVSFFAVPIVAKGYVKGVLQVFHRRPFAPDEAWLDFLRSLGEQAAIAVDNAELFNAIQRSNDELGVAYDATIEGWSRALDLRDKETEGHTLRVTTMTADLARRLGIPDEELAHIRRGALLHDIGKMGIPDAILLKPAPLTPSEWEIMRLHPVYAHELLTPIAYLKPALAIPHSHHEKWDGTGYPNRLSGTQIPLHARIFAVVDVWDALSHDRPYRAAWLSEQVFAYLREQSGKYFDPEIVDAFLRMMEQ